MQCQMLHVNNIQNALHYNSEIILPVFSVAYTEETHTLKESLCHLKIKWTPTSKILHRRLSRCPDCFK